MQAIQDNRTDFFLDAHNTQVMLWLMNNCNIMTQHTKKFVVNIIFNISRDAVIKVNNIVCSVQEAVLTTTQVYAFVCLYSYYINIHRYL